MRLSFSDWLIIALYFVASAAIGLAYVRKSSRSLEEYFVSGRALPWWLAGTSMVATTFSADTPLVVAGLVARYGVAGNWLWWNGAISGILTVFFFARLWRRAGVITDLEFAELRYGGKPAAALRGFRAIYLALPINLIIMGWVTRAMVTVLQISLNINPWKAAVLLFAITAGYTIFAGLWGVVVTDTFQFVVKMGGVIALAYFAVDRSAASTSSPGFRWPTSARTMPRSVCCPRSARRGCPSRRFSSSFPYSGGRHGTPEPNREEAATWHNGFWRRRTSGTVSWPRSGSTSPTTPCGRGRGSSSASWL